MSVAQRAFDALSEHLAGAGAVGTDPGGPVRIRPAALTRTGRSRRDGALLDLQLTVLVTVEAEAPLPVLESLLVAAESHPHVSIGPLPVDEPGLGFSIVVAVPVPIEEPTGPPVTDTRVEVHPFTTLSGEVLDAAGRGVPGSVVSSTTTRQRSLTDSAGRFQLLAAGGPTTLTAAKDGRTATITVEPDGEPVRLVLPEGS
ncbi:MAG: carboxypeptidase regulatory-like domain-containing protein [Propionibacteriaceae bacterium]|nr:carboxypeptidase regulatory-like domain-containing protein [Propionibacteriaceae bacterium]